MRAHIIQTDGAVYVCKASEERDKESIIPMYEYTSQCGEHKAYYLDSSGLVQMGSDESLMRGAESTPYIPPREGRGVDRKVQLSILNREGSRKLNGCGWSIQKMPQRLWLVYSVFQSIEVSRVSDPFGAR
jgi:hypothetical protein